MSLLSFGYSVYRIHAVIVHFLYFSVGLNFPQGQYHELDVVFKTSLSKELKISNTHGHNFQRSVIPNIKNSDMNVRLSTVILIKFLLLISSNPSYPQCNAFVFQDILTALKRI